MSVRPMYVPTMDNQIKQLIQHVEIERYLVLVTTKYIKQVVISMETSFQMFKFLHLKCSSLLIPHYSWDC